MYKIAVLSVSAYVLLTYQSLAQTTDDTKKDFHVKGSVTVTNYGIGYIPAFSLGKPAAIFNLSLGKRRFFFEPQFRFSLEGEPWTFLFIGRYKIKDDGKFRISSGASLGMNYKQLPFTINGVPTHLSSSFRYVIGELAPNYFVSKNTSVGLYYLYLRGIDVGTAINTHFLGVNINFSHVKLGNRFFARFVPHVYYLRLDGKEGYYFYPTLTLLKNNFPLSVQSIVNKAIHSNITGSQDFTWNISLIYSFNKTYTEK